MDLDYQLKCTEFSLEEISAIRVAKELFNSCKMKPSDSYSRETMKNNARKRLLKLNLPKRVEEKVEGFIGVINANVFCRPYYDLINQCDHPIITMLGTVDVEKTLEGILSDANVDKCARFRLACEFCHENQIFEIGRLLTEWEVLECNRPKVRSCSREPKDLVWFWTDAYGYIFKEQIHLRDLSQKACDDGFQMALKSGNDSSVKYFIERTSPEAICGVVGLHCMYPLMLSSDSIFSPATYCLLFSKMTEDKQRTHMSTMCYLLLQSLLIWPYQRFFLRAARLLTEHLRAMDYLEIMRTLFCNARTKCNDYDYNKMLEEFFELGSDHRKQALTMGNWHCFDTSDRPFLKWLRSKMSTSEKEAFLLISKKYSLHL